jgi:hypothetical protein
MRRTAPILGVMLLVACSSGNTPPPDAGRPDAGPPDAGTVDAGPLPYDPTCSKPGTLGNELGIGHFCCDGQPGCTTSGTDCTPVPHGPVLLCTTVSPGVTQWFCTTPCTCDSQCGEGAICACTSGGCGCTPDVCAGETVGSACYADGGPIPYPDGGH